VSDEPIIDLMDAPERERYEVHVDGALAGFATYRLHPSTIEFLHTEIEPDMEGKGLASRLIEFALDDARSRGLAVLPFCPFMREFIQRHREYAELVPEGRRASFGL
jgi:uncharacterized protein